MRVIKLGIISAIFFAFLITAFSLFIPSHIRISKAIDINITKDSLIHEVSDPANWKKWYPGADSMNVVVVDGKIKGMQAQNGQNIIITGINDSTVLAVTSGGGAKRSESGWNFFPVNSSTTVQWYMDFHLKWYPWEKFSSLMLEKRYGPLMEKGLANLKAIAEK